MTETALIQRLETKIDRLDRKLAAIAAEKKKGTWVKVGFVTDLTGWDREKLRQAREQGLVEFKEDAKLGRVYNLESIPPMFIKKTSSI